MKSYLFILFIILIGCSEKTVETNTAIQETPINEEKTKKVESSGQCKANTKKGTRCSRSAGSNGYCWQHGG